MRSMTIELAADPIDANVEFGIQSITEAGERDLVERARTDPHALADIYRLHSLAIANYLHRRTGDAHAAEDLLSETFLVAMKSLPRFRHDGTPLRFWLYRLATNAANRWMRTHARLRRRETVSAISMHAHAGDIEGKQDVAFVTRALQQLSGAHQSVLVLHIVEGLTLEQVAQVLGCRVGTVKSRLFRAREALRHEARSLAADDIRPTHSMKAATP